MPKCKHCGLNMKPLYPVTKRNEGVYIVWICPKAEYDHAEIKRPISHAYLFCTQKPLEACTQKTTM